MSEKKLSWGIVYSAVGLNYNQEAITSAKSVKRFHPDAKITIYSDHPKFLESKFKNLFHRIRPIDIKPIKIDKYKVAPYAKLQKKAMSSFPYDITLYLDCDTKVYKPIKELFIDAKIQQIHMIFILRIHQN